ncbi:hypothetical protein KSS87_004518 [Heliosperma pusillum]|nr:hypothetical protein KSS87_004518 [Heliosperma pusillum]
MVHKESIQMELHCQDFAIVIADAITFLCYFRLAWDALFFYIPVVDGKNNCLYTDLTLEIIASVVRTFIDLFYLGHIILQFHTGYISPDSRKFGRGEPVKNLKYIATRYLKSHFIVDVLAVLPLPQILVLIPRLGWPRSSSKDLLTLVIFIQYIPRFFRVYPLYKEVMRTSGVVTGRSWSGAVLNLLLYVLASHKYLNSATAKVEEMRSSWHDTEKWMSHRSLTDDLKKRIRKYELCKWQDTRGVNEDTIISELPRDLRVDIKRHLWNKCFYHIKKVPWFESLNDEMLDEMCDWLKPIIYMEKSLIMRQGHSIKEVLFIMRGTLSIKSAGDATLAPLNPGDYCGVELLTWAADPNNLNSSVMPKSKLTIESLTVFEAFTLKSDELRSLMKHLSVLRGQKLQYELKSHSEQWKVQAAYHIQTAWRRHSKWKPTLSKPEDVTLVMESTTSSFHPSNYGSKFANIALERLRLDSPRSQTGSLSQTASREA